MSDNKKGESKGKLAGIYTTYRSEFAKIVWPGRPELIRKTVTVAIISGLFGIYISVLDGMLGAVFSNLVNLIS